MQDQLGARSIARRAATCAANAARLVILAGSIALVTVRPLAALEIKEVTSPAGIKAWLVEEKSVPLIAMRFDFEGGSTQDPAGREGTANLAALLLDEGAGELKSADFQKRVADLSVRMSFAAERDALQGSFEMLSANHMKAADLLRLALTRPRFDVDVIERTRGQMLARLAFEASDAGKVANEAWYATAFAGHPYARPVPGTRQSVAAITKEDLEGWRRRVFARSNLRVAVVGNIDARSVGTLLDRTFGGLPAKAQLTAVPKVMPRASSPRTVIEVDVPQSVATFGVPGVERADKDYLAALVLNHILGGSSADSRLVQEVRHKRGLAYFVYTVLHAAPRSAMLFGGVGTKNEEIGQTIELVRAEFRRLAESGPTADEVEGAKSYLKGSFALRLDSNAKIAEQLVVLQSYGLGRDYIGRRSALIDAVTIDDVRRVAKALLKPDELILAIAGKPKL